MQIYTQNNQNKPAQKNVIHLAGNFVSGPPDFESKNNVRQDGLGCITNNSAGSEIQKVTNVKKKAGAEKFVGIKKKIGRRVKRVKECGCRLIDIEKAKNFGVSVVQGEKGSVWYLGAMRCGSLWLCPSCSYKIAKARAEELYQQLKIYREKGKTVLFVTFTLQHHRGQSLKYLREMLKKAFEHANEHQQFRKYKEATEYYRALEIKYGENGWHPHFHALFVGDEKVLLSAIKIFLELYENYLQENGFLVNEHTTTSKKWNGDLDEMTDYFFKGQLEKEITGGGLKNGGVQGGKTFFELIDDDETPEQIIQEYISGTKKARSFSKSKTFFKDVLIKTDEEIISDDKKTKNLCTIPYYEYRQMQKIGIAPDFLIVLKFEPENAVKFLELYDIDASFLEGIPPENHLYVPPGAGERFALVAGAIYSEN